MPFKTRDPEPEQAAATEVDQAATAERALANALPQVVWSCDAHGRLEWVNDRWFELTGLTEEQTLDNKGALAAVHSDDRGELVRRWRHAIESSMPAEVEYRIRTSRGEYRWHVGRMVPVRDTSGAITRWVAAVLDIHDRRMAEEALRASERRFETVFDLSPYLLAITRRSDGVLLDVNDAFLELTGFRREEVIGKSTVELGMWSSEERAAFFDTITAHPQRGLEVAIRGRDGEVLHVISSSAQIELDGEPCLVTASADITDLYAAETALRESEARARAHAHELEALMDAVPAVVWVSRDTDCREVDGNRAAYEALRIPMGENLSRAVRDASASRHFSVLANGTEVPADQLLLQCAARGEERRNYETEIRFHDGQVTYLYGSAIPLRDPAGAPRGAIGAYLDVTRLKQVEEALRRADRTKDEFLARLSHELRNPLTPILTSARLLERRVSDEDRHDVEAIIRQVKHLVRLVDDLLDISRVASGRVTLSMTRLELAAVVAQAVEATAPFFDERDHRLEVVMPSEPLLIDGDEVRLTQVVDNLLSNAARYTPPGGTITVTGTCEGDSIVLRVRDTGIGIDPAILPELFGVFVQGSDGPERKQGLGMGLSLVRALTELHGGSVTARSEGPGRGSEFEVRLPAAVAGVDRSARVTTPPSAARGPQFHKARVLLVDDNPGVLDGLTRLVTVFGYDVRAVLDPLDAIGVAEQFRPEIAILDIGLPVMDGHTLARELRSRLSDSPPVLIAMSGYGQAQDLQRSAEAGFALHLVKPVDIDELIDALSRFTAGQDATAAAG